MVSFLILQMQILNLQLLTIPLRQANKSLGWTITLTTMLLSKWAWKKSKPQKLFRPERSRRAEQLLGFQA